MTVSNKGAAATQIERLTGDTLGDRTARGPRCGLLDEPARHAGGLARLALLSGALEHGRASLLQQARAAVPAERRAAAVHCAARAPMPGNARLRAGEQASSRAELRVGLLQRGLAARKHV